MDTATDPRAPSLAAVAEPEDIEKEGVSYLHSTHCLPSGNIMVHGAPGWVVMLLTTYSGADLLHAAGVNHG